ncbi:MAG: WecB/TagA/CpsF family glycosyltransferase [Clostridia bacterium]|nr:WecB/TagA/CpsF family glycosyltransferase [Clostridia bacterium]
MEKINIRGIPFDNVTKDEALSLISRRIEEAPRTVVVTPNAEIVEACIEDVSLLPLITTADVILPDGVGVIKASNILGTPLKERVPGVEVGEALFGELKDSHSFFILGGKEGVADDAAKKMAEKYGTKFAGTHHGYFIKEDGSSDKVIDEINSSGADILYVCLGFPFQERWLSDNMDKLPDVALAMALGGSADVWAGNVRRAPKLFRKLGLEWFWRLIRQPSRLGRTMKLPKFYLGMKKYKKQMDKKQH